MKQIFLLIFLGLKSVCFSQIYSSSCNSTVSIKNIYRNDVYRLAVSRLQQTNSNFKDSVEIPALTQDTIAKALYSIHNMQSSTLKDTVMNLFGFADFNTASEYEKDSSHAVLVGYNNSRTSTKRSYISVSNTASWAAEWENGNYSNTNNLNLNNLMTRYNLGARLTLSLPTYKTYIVYCSSNINTSALAQQFSLINGVQYADPLSYCCDGNRISLLWETDGITINFVNACGDCPSGCTRTRTWSFKAYIYTDCHVEYLGTVDYGYSFISSEPYVCMRFSTLPITFTSIVGYIKLGKPTVVWNMAADKQIENFLIEKSIDGLQFFNAGVEKPKNFTGTDISYVWIDSNALVNSTYNYYRIVAKSHTGSRIYSDIVRIKIDDKRFQKIYPNPVHDKVLHLNLNNVDISNSIISVYSKEGKKVFSKSLSSANTSSINLPDYILPGIYVAILSNVKQRFKQLIINL